MAAPRKSAQQVAAREKARTKAAELTARHEKLIDLATEYFQLQEHAEQVRAEAQAKAEAILAQAEHDAGGSLMDAAAKVRAMLATGESKNGVAARLGISTAELKRNVELAHDDEPGNAPAPAQGEEAVTAEQQEEPSEHAA